MVFFSTWRLPPKSSIFMGFSMKSTILFGLPPGNLQEYRHLHRSQNVANVTGRCWKIPKLPGGCGFAETTCCGRNRSTRWYANFPPNKDFEWDLEWFHGIYSQLMFLFKGFDGILMGCTLQESNMAGWRMDHVSMTFLLQPPWTEDFPLPCLIARGYRNQNNEDFTTLWICSRYHTLRVDFI